jgi:signal transduction histidine kinase
VASNGWAIVLAAAAVLFVAIFLLCGLTGGSDTGLTLLYVLPVALVALELGLVAGLGAALLATGLMIVWATTSTDLGVPAMLARGLVFVVTGPITGRFSDHMRRVHVAQRRLINAGLDLAPLEGSTEPSEVVASRAAELSGVLGARATVDEAAPIERGLVGSDPLRFVLGREAGVGATVEVEFAGGAEDRAALAVLVLQASVARENELRLRSERERARLQAALAEAQGRLAERGAQLRTVLESYEKERSDLAHELHEDAAQTLAAVLLGLDVLERDLGSERSADRLAALRTHVGDTLGGLRKLAVSLRPPVLDGIGLVPALERLGRDGGTPGLRIDVDLEAIADRLTAADETAIYRAVEDAAALADGEGEVDVRYDGTTGELRVVVRFSREASAGALALLRARAELLGGTIDVKDHRLEVRVRFDRDASMNMGRASGTPSDTGAQSSSPQRRAEVSA